MAAMITLSASWTGVGDLVRSNSNSHTISKGYKYNSHYSGTYRDATAQVSGMEPGVQYWAQSVQQQVDGCLHQPRRLINQRLGLSPGTGN